MNFTRSASRAAAAKTSRPAVQRNSAFVVTVALPHPAWLHQQAPGPFHAQAPQPARCPGHVPGQHVEASAHPHRDRDLQARRCRSRKTSLNGEGIPTKSRCGRLSRICSTTASSSVGKCRRGTRPGPARGTSSRTRQPAHHLLPGAEEVDPELPAGARLSRRTRRSTPVTRSGTGAGQPEGPDHRHSICQDEISGPAGVRSSVVLIMHRTRALAGTTVCDARGPAHHCRHRSTAESMLSGRNDRPISSTRPGSGTRRLPISGVR
jgi:hypothetical protein